MQTIFSTNIKTFFYDTINKEWCLASSRAVSNTYDDALSDTELVVFFSVYLYLLFISSLPIEVFGACCAQSQLRRRFFFSFITRSCRISVEGSKLCKPPPQHKKQACAVKLSKLKLQGLWSASHVRVLRLFYIHGVCVRCSVWVTTGLLLMFVYFLPQCVCIWIYSTWMFMSFPLVNKPHPLIHFTDIILHKQAR